jgi:hypothetical protein
MRLPARSYASMESSERNGNVIATVYTELDLQNRGA